MWAVGVSSDIPRATIAPTYYRSEPAAGIAGPFPTSCMRARHISCGRRSPTRCARQLVKMQIVVAPALMLLAVCNAAVIATTVPAASFLVLPWPRAPFQRTRGPSRILLRVCSGPLLHRCPQASALASPDLLSPIPAIHMPCRALNREQAATVLAESCSLASPAWPRVPSAAWADDLARLGLLFNEQWRP